MRKERIESKGRKERKESKGSKEREKKRKKKREKRERKDVPMIILAEMLETIIDTLAEMQKI